MQNKTCAVGSAAVYWPALACVFSSIMVFGGSLKNTLMIQTRYLLTVNDEAKNVDLLHSVPRTGSGSPVQAPGLCGMATRHRDPALSHSVYS